MIRALCEYFDYLVAAGLVKDRFGWAEYAVPLYLDLNSDGTVRALLSTTYTEKNEKGKDVLVVPREIMPYHTVRSTNIAGYVFGDRAEYLFGIGERGDRQFTSMREIQHAVLDEVDSEIAKTVLRYFDTWDPEKANEVLTDEQKQLISEHEGCCIALSVCGSKVAEDPACVAAYDQYVNQHGISGSTLMGLDCITGEDGRSPGKKDFICRVHPKIKGIRAAAKGAPICTINNNSCVHATGREQGFGTPMSERTVYRYSTALEYLTHSRLHNYYDQYSGMNIICWSSDCEETQQAALLYAAAGANMKAEDKTDNDAVEYLKRLCLGIDAPPASFDPSARMYVVGLDSRDGYIIRQKFFFSGRFDELMKGAIEHYRNTRVCGHAGVSFISIYEELCPKKSDGSPINDKSGLTADLTTSILSNGKYPEQMLDLMLWRIEKSALANEDFIPYIRQVGFLRAYLNKNAKEDVDEMLNTENRDIGYICGRIFAAATNIEFASKQGEKTRKSVAQKMGEAMRHPADFFPMLHADLSGAYLKKLYSKRSTEALAISLEKELSEFVAMLPETGYPPRLDRKQQAMFCVGYYQQRNEYIQKALERKAAKEAKANDESDKASGDAA